jgi:hypothetical protein
MYTMIQKLALVSSVQSRSSFEYLVAKYNLNNPHHYAVQKIITLIVGAMRVERNLYTSQNVTSEDQMAGASRHEDI